MYEVLTKSYKEDIEYIKYIKLRMDLFIIHMIS